MTHIGISKLTIIGSDNGLLPGRRQAIIWTNAGILLIGLLGTNFSGILKEIYTFSFKKMHLKMSSGKRRPFCLGLNMLMLSHHHARHFGYSMSTYQHCYQAQDCFFLYSICQPHLIGHGQHPNLQVVMDGWNVTLGPVSIWKLSFPT